jgi:hypothetical protein
MMKIAFLSMAAVAAFSIPPAAAQDWHGSSGQSSRLQTEIEDGVRSGAFSSRDVPALRKSLRQLMTMERRFAPGGISGREGEILEQHGAALSQQIDFAVRNRGYHAANPESRAAWEARYDSDHRAAWDARYLSERSAQYDAGGLAANAGSTDRFSAPNRGDRFAGDVRVGQRFSSRMGPIPAEYRIDYRDSDQVYYGYDDQRIYRVDRRSGLILGLLDLPN